MADGKDLADYVAAVERMDLPDDVKLAVCDILSAVYDKGYNDGFDAAWDGI